MTCETFTPAQSEGPPQRPPIVYLLDDDSSFLRALSRLLRAADYRIETFASAEEFLKCDRSEAAGCVVLDLQMPDVLAGVTGDAGPSRRSSVCYLTTRGSLLARPAFTSRGPGQGRFLYAR